jgi:hypothetical protein
VSSIELPPENPARVAGGDDRLLAGYDDSQWTDEERDALRAEAVDSLGWEGMEAYQDDGP